MASKPIYSTYGEADQLVKDYYNRKGIPFDVNRYTTDVQALEGGRVAPSFYGGGSGSGSGYGSSNYASFNYTPPKPPEPYPWLMDVVKDRVQGKGVFDENVYQDAINTLNETRGQQYQEGKRNLYDDLAKGNIDPNSGVARASLNNMQTEGSRNLMQGTRELTQYRNDAIQNAIQNAMGVGGNIYGTEMSGYGPYAGASTNAAIAGYRGLVDQTMQDKTLQSDYDKMLLGYQQDLAKMRLQEDFNQPDWTDYLGAGVGLLSNVLPGAGSAYAWSQGNPTALGVSDSKKKKLNQGAPYQYGGY